MGKESNVDWNSLVYYDETSTTGLRWKVGRVCPKMNRRVTKIGAEAGSKKGKRSVLTIDKQSYYSYRIVYTICKGPIPDGMEVDHLDGDCTNNAIWNLELKDSPRNNRNMKKSGRNTSGVTGVSHMNSKGCEYWVAYWVDGKLKAKCFNIAKLGEEEAFQQACEHRARMIAELNEQGAGYTDRHGK